MILRWRYIRGRAKRFCDGWNGLGAFRLQAHLTASSFGVVAFLATQSGRDSRVAQNAQKLVLALYRRARPRQAFRGVVRNQIDLCWNSPRNFYQLMRLLIGVVDAGAEVVFEKDMLYFPGHVLGTFVQQRGKTIFALNGLDLTAHRLVRDM